MKIMYCFRNRMEESKQILEELDNQLKADIEFVPVYCMRLCFLCQNQYVCSVDGALIVDKDETKFIEKVNLKLLEINI